MRLPEITRPASIRPIVFGVAAVLVLGASVVAAGFLPPATPGGQPFAQSSNKPSGTEAPEGTPDPARVQDVVGCLGTAGINTTSSDFQALAAKYGVGGAVRILRFAHAAGKTTADIAAMRDAGKGWGQIRQELKLSIGPGIGSIMGHGCSADSANAKNANKSGKSDSDANESPEPSESPGD